MMRILREKLGPLVTAAGWAEHWLTRMHDERNAIPPHSYTDTMDELRAALAPFTGGEK